MNSMENRKRYPASLDEVIDAPGVEKLASIRSEYLERKKMFDVGYADYKNRIANMRRYLSEASNNPWNTDLSGTNFKIYRSAIKQKKREYKELLRAGKTKFKDERKYLDRIEKEYSSLMDRIISNMQSSLEVLYKEQDALSESAHLTAYESKKKLRDLKNEIKNIKKAAKNANVIYNKNVSVPIEKKLDEYRLAQENAYSLNQDIKRRKSELTEKVKGLEKQVESVRHYHLI